MRGNVGVIEMRRGVDPVHPDRALCPGNAKLHRGGIEQRADGLRVRGIDTVAQRQPGDGAVHRASVDIDITQPLGEQPRYGAFAGGGGAVDGDDAMGCFHGLLVVFWEGGDDRNFLVMLGDQLPERFV